MHIPLLIERKREGGELSAEEIAFLIHGFTSGEIPDYQMAAMAMAIYFAGMTEAETAALTLAMRDSGGVYKYPPDSPPKVDKHSTGGIGDKVSLVLAPLLACDDLWVPMVSGRGLGITGGTLDKLESIPGFHTTLDDSAALAQLDRIGVFMAGQSAGFCPADKKLYALRDVTGTVPSRPLIVASIMSKKLAESLDRLVLDVKFGSGAFMKSRKDAGMLAAGLTSAGERNGVETSFLLSEMNEPLGRTAGNALEVAEAVEALQGGGPEDLVKLTLDLAERVSSAGRERLAGWLRDGSAWNKFVSLVEAQGGDASSLERIREVHASPIVHPVLSDRAGRVALMDAGCVGRAALALGAGRRRADDGIDPAVGFSRIAKVGESVERGQPLFFIHARDESTLQDALRVMDPGVLIE